MSTSDPSGQPLSTDCQKNHGSNTALTDGELDFRLLAEAMPQIVWLTRPDGWNIFFNHQWVEYTGLSLEESYGHGWNKPFHPDDQHLAWNAWQNAINNNGIYSLECRLRRADGIYRWWLVRGVPGFDENGHIRRWYGTCTDIQDIKLAEENLLSSKAKLEVALNSMSDAVCISDSAGRLIDFNDAFVTFYRFKNREECARTLHEYPKFLDVYSVDGELLTLEQWVMPRALLGETGTNAEFELRRRDTGERWTGLYNYAPIKDSHGAVVGAVVSVRDITERNRIQERQILLAQRSEALLNLPGAAEGVDERTFLQRGLAVVEKLTGSQISFAHFVHEDQESIELVSWSQATLTRYCTATYDKHYPISQAGIWANALRQRATVLVNDYATATGKHGLPEGHAHLTRLISVPVMDGGLVRMMLGVGNRLVDYSESDVETVRLVADAIWRIVQQRRSHVALVESEKSLREAQHVAGLGSYVLDISNGLWESSPELDYMFGIDASYERSVRGWTDLIHCDDREMMDDYLKNEVLGRGQTFNKEYRITCHKDKVLRWVHGMGRLEFDERGNALRMLGTIQDITASKKVQAKIESLAFSDPLTGLANRRLLQDRMQQAMALRARHQQLNALLLVDLDDFKTLNDTLGHQQGDLLLQQVAERLNACIREGDTVARLGGDEFVVMLSDLSENVLEAAIQAKAVGEKISAVLNQSYRLTDVTYQCTPSIGITIFGDHQENSDEPLMRADLALYEAKAAGRNTMRFFDPAMQAEVAERGALEAGLREALKHDRFTLHYQAQVTDRHQVTGVEALVRWLDPQRGMVSPAQFIPVAEKTGLIFPLGNWVLNTACRQLAMWACQPGFAHLTMAVNVSARQFHQSDFVEHVLAVLQRTGANARLLKLELTESLLLNNVEAVIAKMRLLKDKGVSFSLDDFGTGYSSLSYLKRLPLDQLKIDQGFVRDILDDPNDAAIARMVIALADTMGLTVIAEGVEMEVQRDLLAGMGCRNYQGYLFSRPVPIEAFEAFVNGF